jgi:hypothetical protein
MHVALKPVADLQQQLLQHVTVYAVENKTHVSYVG